VMGIAKTKGKQTVKNSGAPSNNIKIPVGAGASRSRNQPVQREELLRCSVCTEDFVDADNVRILPCGHIYHRHCIDPWLLDYAGTCPLW
jgi:hypothetical protein